MIEIKNLKKAFDEKIVSNDISLKIEDGELLAIIGRSGEGKSVLLKQMIGLITPDSGQVFIDNINVTNLSDKEKQLAYQKCGYVFQFAALLDSLNIFENIGITLLEQGNDPEDVKKLVIKKLHDVGLSENILLRYPHELSGGMKKRVGLARTLMLNPQIILYDEPTTGLDPITVKVIHELIKNTQLKFQTTSVVISHDIEIFKYVDRVAMLHGGKIVFLGKAKNIWDDKNPYIYQFIRGLSEGPMKAII